MNLKQIETQIQRNDSLLELINCADTHWFKDVLDFNETLTGNIQVTQFLIAHLRMTGFGSQQITAILLNTLQTHLVNEQSLLRIQKNL